MTEKKAKKITLDPRNARSHPDRNRSAVEKSLRELGAGRCPTFCDQMGKYRYPVDEATGEIIGEKPIKKDDDLPDCIRYILHTLEGAPLAERSTLVYDDRQEISTY
jgi:hypothetical protein